MINKMLMIILMLFLFSCKKYLDIKPDKALQIPGTLQDLQALMDNSSVMNGQYGLSFDESSADNFYLTQETYNDRDPENRNTYTWQNLNYRNYPNDWSYLYIVVSTANQVLDNQVKIKPDSINQMEWNNVRGSALYYRSFAFLQGAFIFCNGYDGATAQQDLGISLRLTADVTVPSNRSTLQETYDQVIGDLKLAAPLLPVTPQHVFRPSRIAAYALLARTYLSMRVYDSCLKYSDLALQLKSDLLDYNTVTTNPYYSFQQFNTEIYFDHAVFQPNYVLSSIYYGLIDTLLYNSYSDNDLRKSYFYQKQDTGYRFKGSYDIYAPFIGIASDEVYLMRAESYARTGNIEAGLNDLNRLLINRWMTGTFVPFTAVTPQDAVNIILTERRKELPFRNLRWMDIKRLNKEGANITLTRIVNGQTYTLPPNDKRYALALPDDIVMMTGMLQNPY